MEKTIKLALNNFPQIPSSLCLRAGAVVPTTKINLASLFHHYYLDTYGHLPPSPDPTQFEHVRYLTNDSDFRFLGTGLGATTQARRNRSSELGQAFCRMFLHDHLDIKYFGAIGQLLSTTAPSVPGRYKIKRNSPGDTPDYFCAKNAQEVFLAEAKGRYTSISFKNREFARWRQQFNTVEVQDDTGTPRSLKGFIVATRFATEAQSAVQSCLYAEDPVTPGEREWSGQENPSLGADIISRHYANIAEKLGQPVLAASLVTGSQIPEELGILAGIWRLEIGPLAGTKFVGGYFSPTGRSFLQKVGDAFQIAPPDPLMLGLGSPTFFGIEYKIFSEVCSLARTPRRLADRLRPIRPISTFEQVDHFYSAVSILKDGSILSPADLLRPIEQERF